MKAAHLFLVVILSFSFGALASVEDLSLEDWLQSQKKISVDRMMKNISSEGTAPGTVIASPSKNNPNYYFHWIRDAALTIDQVILLYASEKEENNSIYLKRIQEFIQLSELQQNEPSPMGLGEPRYLVSGQVDTTPWSRPQSDGPALRALALMRFLKLRPMNDVYYSRTAKVIKRDLQYVILNWQLPCFDLWEELKGLHFYTQAAHLTALGEGAEFFKADREFSIELLNAAELAKVELEKYWDNKNLMIGASRNLEVAPGSQYKISNLDTAVILASLHSNHLTGDNHQLFFGPQLDRFLSTAYLLENEFEKIYVVNLKNQAPAIGRFSDDVYFGGNPWYMTTLAFAEFYFKVAIAIQNSESILITEQNLRFFRRILAMNDPSLPDHSLNEFETIAVQSPMGRNLIANLKLRGDEYFETVRYYTGSQGEMSEQFDRQAGVPVSALDLTWSYASFLSALHARDASSSTGR